MPKCDIIYLDLKKWRESEIIIVFIWLYFNLLRSDADSFSLWAQLGPSKNQQVF